MVFTFIAVQKTNYNKIDGIQRKRGDIYPPEMYETTYAILMMV